MTKDMTRDMTGERRESGAPGWLTPEAVAVIAEELGARPEEIGGVSALSRGMTNHSFLFSCRGRKYIARVPGEGTARLINRRQEAEVYRAIAGRGFCDDPVCIDPENGYKVTPFLEGARTCNPSDPQDLRRCMAALRRLHDMRLTVGHSFDIFERIEFYETLWDGAPSLHEDYRETKAGVLALRGYIDACAGERCLAHIDAVPDNFLFFPDQSGGEGLHLIDWEYAGMQDPHVDIAMFCIYSLYDRRQADGLIDIYFGGRCDERTRIKIYCYIAACGLLWSNWCEYKKNLGVEFGEYEMRQYRFARDYCEIVRRHGEGDAR